MYDVFYSGTKPNLFAHEQYAASLEETEALAQTRCYWFLSDNDYTAFDFGWVPTPHDVYRLHVWFVGVGKTYFVNRHAPVNLEKFHTVETDVSMGYDIFFISYNEPNAEQNWNSLSYRFPMARRINKVKGIVNAHKVAALQSNTTMFYVVDADAIVDVAFNFDFVAPPWDEDSVYVWHSRNPINDLEYGYGGVKLLPRQTVLDLKSKHGDMTTSISEKFNVIPLVSNITAFNTDPFSTWKSAFRECVKLSSGLIARQVDYETKHRLDVWCTTGSDKLYGEWAIRGANDGREIGSNKNANLSSINDFDWLKVYYDQKYND